MRQFTTNSVALVAAACLVGGICGAANAQDTVERTTVVTTRHAGRPAPVRQVIHVIVNEAPVTFSGASPIMTPSNAVLVPLRGVFEQMGGKVQWEPKTQVITGARPGHQFRIRVGSHGALVDGTEKVLNTPPQLIGGVTYVPLRFTGEALGARVAWDPETDTVTIQARPATVSSTVQKTTVTTTTTTDPK